MLDIDRLGWRRERIAPGGRDAERGLGALLLEEDCLDGSRWNIDGVDADGRTRVDIWNGVVRPHLAVASVCVAARRLNLCVFLARRAATRMVGLRGARGHDRRRQHPEDEHARRRDGEQPARKSCSRMSTCRGHGRLVYQVHLQANNKYRLRRIFLLMPLRLFSSSRARQTSSQTARPTISTAKIERQRGHSLDARPVVTRSTNAHPDFQKKTSPVVGALRYRRRTSPASENRGRSRELRRMGEPDRQISNGGFLAGTSSEKPGTAESASDGMLHKAPFCTGLQTGIFVQLSRHRRLRLRCIGHPSANAFRRRFWRIH